MFRSIWARGVLAVALLLSVALVLSACGSSGPSQTEVQEAEQHGREVQAQKEKARLLKKQIAEIRRKQRVELQRPDSTPNPSPQPTPAQSATPESSPTRTSCGGSLSVGPDTTCGFAQNVRSEYEFEIGEGSGTVDAYSEALGESFEMFCTGAPHECSGAIDAKVYFP